MFDSEKVKLNCNENTPKKTCDKWLFISYIVRRY